MSRNQINEMIAASQRFVICFQFVLQNGRKIHLTSADKKIIYEDICYMPNSGITLDSAHFNDSAHNEVKLRGVFENGGIEKNFDLDGMNVKIFFHFPQKSLFLEWIELLYSEIQYDGMNFILILKPEIYKLHKSILQNFAANCRADFGDNKCKVRSIEYSTIYEVASITKRSIRIVGCTRPDGFFTGGKAYFDCGSKYDIKSHIGDNIILTKCCVQECVAGAGLKITLTPSCDKKFITCCNRYNNAVNFRGEPKIPWCQ